jgi:FKBP-type peptidyl-prolyl cis-trans isomerase SlyD
MVISKDKVVSVIYELRITKKEDEIVEKVTEQKPLTFLLGRGNLLPKFETNLTGLKVGEPFDFVVGSLEAYGQILQEAILDLPKSVFVNEDKIDESLFFIGNVIPMMDKEGNRFSGKVIELADSTVKMDFNHPLAGEDLHFKGQVIDVREATQEELTHGHIHGSNSCQDCNSDCNSGCEEGCK